MTNSFDVTFADGSQTMEWNGVQAFSTNITGNVDTGNNLCLFSTSHWRWRSAARCYGLKIWQDGTLVRDFKPCLVDGKGMLYDTVTESLPPIARHPRLARGQGGPFGNGNLLSLTEEVHEDSSPDGSVGTLDCHLRN